MSDQSQSLFIENLTADGMLDIASEMYRIYHYDNGRSIRIDEPKKLHVKRRLDGTDSHRIVDKKGHGWYIAPGWKAIEWENSYGVRINF